MTGTEKPIRDLDACRKGNCEVCGQPVYYDFPLDSVLCADHTQSTATEQEVDQR